MSACPPYRAGDRVFAIWLEPGKGTGGTRTVTVCTPRAEAAGWKLAVAVAVSGERTVTGPSTATTSPAPAKVATTTPS